MVKATRRPKKNLRELVSKTKLPDVENNNVSDDIIKFSLLL